MPKPPVSSAAADPRALGNGQGRGIQDPGLGFIPQAPGRGAAARPDGGAGPPAAGPPADPLLDWLAEQLRGQRMHLYSTLEASHERLMADLHEQLKVGVFTQADDASGGPWPDGFLPRAPPKESVVDAGVLLGASFGAPLRERDDLAVTRVCGNGPSGAPADGEPAPGLPQVAELDAAVGSPECPTPVSGSKKNGALLLRSDTDRGAGGCSLERLVDSHWFEATFALLIVLNAFAMAGEAQYVGVDTGFEQGFGGVMEPASSAFPAGRVLFDTMETAFGLAFTAEVLIKMSGQRCDFTKSLWNWFDMIIIITWLVNWLRMFVLPLNPMVLRLCRVVRLVRLLRLVRTIQIFDVLHLLVGSLKASQSILLWTTTVLFLMMIFFAILMNYLTTGFVTDPELPEEQRHQVYIYFGTFTRGLLSVFELTLGNWVPITRCLFENVNSLFGPGLMVYRTVVGEACIRIVTGVFICETFKVAQSDDELMIMQRERGNQKHVQKMGRLFQEADDSRDGYLSLEEFIEVVNDSRVKAWLAAMELEVADAGVVFGLVDDGDGKLSAQELVHGIARLKGPARSLDLMATMQEVRRIGRVVESIDRRLSSQGAVACVDGAGSSADQGPGITL